MSRLLWLGAFAALCLTSTGCATMSARSQAESVLYEPFGEFAEAARANAAMKEKLSAALEHAEPEQLPTFAPDVKVMERSFPEGVEVRDGLFKTTAESRFDVVGTFHYSAAGGSAVWFADYDSTARKVLCWPQVPLTWVTLVLWQGLVPLSYPCVAQSRLPTAQGLGMVRLIAESAGASVVVLTETAKNEEYLYSASGVLLKKRDEDSPAKPKENSI